MWRQAINSIVANDLDTYVEKNLQQYMYNYLHTPPKIKIEPENDGLEDGFPFPGVYSQASSR